VLLRLHLRTTMVVVALSAFALGLSVLGLRISTALDEFYGSEGVLARDEMAKDELRFGAEALRELKFAEAEKRYRRALDLQSSLPQPDGGRDTSEAVAGLAEAVANQNRDYEAEELYRRSIEIREHVLLNQRFTLPMSNDSPTSDLYRRYASFLRRHGRSAEADRLLRIYDSKRKQ
jgi:tetratricopeptide (TPR) repeat protein